MNVKTTILSGLLLLLAAPGWANPAHSSGDDEQAVEHAATEFYAGLNALFTGDAAPMEHVWSHSDDVTYMGPAGGILVGWEHVDASWKTQAAAKLGGKVEPEELHVTVAGDLAIVICREMGANQDAHGKPLHVSIRATNTFRKENGEWKMIGHHTDLLPFLENQLARPE